MTFVFTAKFWKAKTLIEIEDYFTAEEILLELIDKKKEIEELEAAEKNRIQELKEKLKAKGKKKRKKNSKDDDASFSSFAEGKNLLVREDVNVNNMKFNISALQNSRKIVKWMFDANTKVGDISNSIYTCGDDYVVVSLSAISPEGNKELKSVRNIISQKIQNDKKFDVISSRLTKSSSLEDAASLFKTVIDTVVGVNFANNNITFNHYIFTI